MNYFIIGDVHGCYFTFQKLLTHWDPQTETLIQVGDLIDRGNYSPEVLQLCINLAAKHENAIFLKGNHEVLCLDHFQKSDNPVWLRNGGEETLEQFRTSSTDLPALLDWMDKLPHKFEKESLLVTHAGLATRHTPYDAHNRRGVLWNRNQPFDIGKIQVFGHTPQHSGEPDHQPELNYINLDTAAVYNQKLTGVKLNQTGDLLSFVRIPTDERDSSYSSPQL